MAESRGKRPRPVADLTDLGTLLGDIGRRGGQRVDADAWRRAVGERVAKRTEPGRVHGKTLTVHVASPTWAQELSFLADAIVARLKDDGVGVERLRFQVRKVRPAPSPVRSHPRVAPAPLPDDLRDRLQQIDDPELRDAIEEAAAYAFGARRARGR